MKKHANEGVAPTMGGTPEAIQENNVAQEVLSMIRGASVAKLRLSIKGTPEECETALRAHGINEFELFKQGDFNTCYYDATTDWNTASDWLGDHGEMIPGQGYPAGTLLFYNELNGVDPVMEATGSADTKVGPLQRLSGEGVVLDEDTFMTDEEREEAEEEKKRERFHPQDESDSIMDSASGGNRGFQSNGPFVGAPGMPGQFASSKTGRQAVVSTETAPQILEKVAFTKKASVDHCSECDRMFDTDFEEATDDGKGGVICSRCAGSTAALRPKTSAPSALREIKPGDRCIYTNSEGKEFHVVIVNAPVASEDYGTIVGVQGLPEEGWSEGDWDNVDLMSLRLDPEQNELIEG